MPVATAAPPEPLAPETPPDGSDIRTGRAGIAVAVAAAALVGGGAVWLTTRGGGAPADVWAPVAVVVTLLATVLAALTPGRVPGRGWPGWLGLAGIAGLAGAGLLSLTWSLSPTLSLEWSARVTALAVATALVAWTMRGPALAVVALGTSLVVGLAGAALAVVDLLRAEPGLLVTGRLSAPINYANGAAALVAIGVPVAVGLAASPRVPQWGRAGLAGLAGILGATAALTVSRGAVLGLVVAAVVLACVSPWHGRALAVLVATGLGVAVALPLLFPGGEDPSSLRRRAVGVLVAGVASLLLAAGVLLAERGLSGRVRIRIPHGRVVVAAAGAAVVVAVLAAGLGSGRVQDAWHDLRARPSTTDAPADRLASAQSNRVDYWDVAVGEIRDAPLLGDGAGTFRVAWYRERPITENVVDAHGWPFALGSELGLAGLLPAAVLLAGLGLAAWRTRRLLVGAPATAAAAYLVVHGAVDWLYALPAVALLGCLVLGGLLGASAPPPGRGRDGRTAWAAVVPVLALALLVPFWRAQANLAEGERELDPAVALGHAQAAARWLPGSIAPLQLEGEILLTAGEPARAATAFAEAVRREPDRWEAWAQLADARRLAGDPRGAAQAAARARELNPRRESR